MHKLLIRLMLSTALVIGGAVAWRLLPRHAAHRLPESLAAFTLDARPQANRYLFDYAGALLHYEEGAHEYLERIASRFHIEALIVSVPALPEGHGVETLAVDLVDRWHPTYFHERIPQISCPSLAQAWLSPSFEFGTADILPSWGMYHGDGYHQSPGSTSPSSMRICIKLYGMAIRHRPPGWPDVWLHR